MAKLSPYLRNGENNHLTFWCPGCKMHHSITYGINGWTWNNDVLKPTFSPSILVRGGHYDTSHKLGDSCWCTYYKEHPEQEAKFKCMVCHSFIKDGKIQFLNDCTHELAGQTVGMVAIPNNE